MTGYVDLQVNGFSGVDFNGDDLELEALELACRRLAEHDVEAFLPTIITDDLSKMCQRLERLAFLRSQSAIAGRLILGLHVEGPFISQRAGFVGAHPAQHVREATLDATKRLIDAGQGLVRLFTLAPEQDIHSRVTSYLVQCGIRVSAGHTDATMDQLRSSIDAGLTGFTHLGNGCPAQLHRHDNIIQRIVFLRENLSVSLIADGFHLPIWVLKNLLDILGADRTFIVSDAISAAALGPGTFQLGSQEIHIKHDGVTLSADGTHFVGSTATMPQMDRLLADRLEVDDTRRHRLFNLNARTFLEGERIGVTVGQT